MTGKWRKLAIDNALMVLFALATAPHKTVLFHAAVVSHQDKAYMFLGKSGTGKSTHARLWLTYIEGTALVNDDNPVVRINDNVATVYGSPGVARPLATVMSATRWELSSCLVRHLIIRSGG